jgi:hypothetical protein
LFRAGREAFKGGDYSSALLRFREAYRLDPAPGTLLNQAVCEEKLGQLANAWQSYRHAIDSLPRSDERISPALKRVVALEQRLAWVTIALDARAPKDTWVRRGEVEFTAAGLGVALPFDPGRHELLVGAPQRRARRYSFELLPGQHAQLVVHAGPLLETAAPASAKAVDQARPRRGSSSRALGHALLGVAAAAVVVDTITGIMLLDRLRTVDERCENKLCDDEGYEAGESGRRLRAIFGVALAIGAVAGGTGAYVLMKDNGSAQVGWRGRF